MGDLLVVTGPPGGGKLKFAARLLGRTMPVTYLAAAHWRDPEEMRRQSWWLELGWRTVEEPLDAAGVVRRYAARDAAVVVDRLSLFLANWVEHGDDPEERLEDLLLASREAPGWTLLITNEAGSRVDAPDADVRLHQALLERCNQRAAAVARRVFLVVGGLPLPLKPWGVAHT
jgi:adenosylcobinamide kinase/adenosylcobinamide-phosphate guanylyltransferase